MTIIEKILTSRAAIWSLILLILGGAFFVFSLHGLKVYLEGKSELGWFQTVLVNLADVPKNAVLLVESGVQFDEDLGLVQRSPQLLASEFNQAFEQFEPAFEDNGYLLVSAYSEEDGINIIYLYDIAAQNTLWKWVPRPSEIVARSEKFQKHEKAGTLPAIETKAEFRSQAPLLLPNGSVVLTSGEGSLSQWSACGELEWINDRHFHHSIEKFDDGFLVPIIAEKYHNKLKEGLRDDGFATLDPQGHLINEWSVLDILFANGMQSKVYGRNVESDPIHLNDAEVINVSDEYVKAGDIMLSSRHLSAVMLFRPSTNKIIWYREGAWMGQHDIDYQGDGVFTWYGNDDVLAGKAAGALVYGHSSIYRFDSKTGEITKPFDDVFAQLKIADDAQSNHRMLRNGDAFVEQSNEGVQWRISENGPRWRYVHLNNSGIGAMHWSRYLYADEVNLEWIGKTACATN